MNNSITSAAFKKAHELKKSFATWSAALRAAWAWVKIKAGRLTEIAYTKADGSIRKATVGTAPEGSVKGTGRTVSVSTLLTYWDMGAQAFRSFHITNLVL